MELVAHPSMVLFGQEQSLFQAELKCDCSGSPTMWETQGQKPSKTMFNNITINEYKRRQKNIPK
jgi:hypothetical protein